jgi:hypothetical protein
MRFMRSWVWAWVIVLALGCGETTDSAVRTGSLAHDGGPPNSATGGASQGGQSGGGGASGSGGRAASSSGAAGSGVTGGAAGEFGGSSGTGPNDASADGPAPRDAAPDARTTLADGGCVPLPRSQAPDSSLYCTAELCRTGSGWEIITQDPRGFYMGHLIWILVIGNQYFVENRYSAGDSDAGFAITDQQYAGLERGDPVHAYYGGPPVRDASVVPPNARYCGEF